VTGQPGKEGGEDNLDSTVRMGDRGHDDQYITAKTGQFYHVRTIGIEHLEQDH
jgi:hypothetical protein